MLSNEYSTSGIPAQGKSISLAPAPMSEVESMMSRLRNLVSGLEDQQSEIASRLRVVLAPEYPSAPGQPSPECSSDFGSALADIGSRIAAVIDRNAELLARLAI
jgi:hypothetical protein